MKLTEALRFGFASELDEAGALRYVRDVKRSLGGANLLGGLQVLPGEPPRVSAHLPVTTPLFGRRELPFLSELRNTEAGAELVPLPFTHAGRGWAEVGGEARVEAAGAGSRVEYTLNVTIHLDLPEADRWGTKALTKMIELTAGTVLRQLSERLPRSIEAAARTEGAQAERA